MPTMDSVVANFRTLREAHEALLVGLPMGLALSQRLPIFFNVFQTTATELSAKGTNRESLRLWESGEQFPTETSLNKLEKAAKDLLVGKGWTSTQATRVARWLARGSPPTTKKAPAKSKSETGKSQEHSQAITSSVDSSQPAAVSEDSPYITERLQSQYIKDRRHIRGILLSIERARADRQEALAFLPGHPVTNEDEARSFWRTAEGHHVHHSGGSLKEGQAKLVRQQSEVAAVQADVDEQEALAPTFGARAADDFRKLTWSLRCEQYELELRDELVTELGAAHEEWVKVARHLEQVFLELFHANQQEPTNQGQTQEPNADNCEEKPGIYKFLHHQPFYIPAPNCQRDPRFVDQFFTDAPDRPGEPLQRFLSRFKPTAHNWWRQIDPGYECKHLGIYYRFARGVVAAHRPACACGQDCPCKGPNGEDEWECDGVSHSPEERGLDIYLNGHELAVRYLGSTIGGYERAVADKVNQHIYRVKEHNTVPANYPDPHTRRQITLTVSLRKILEEQFPRQCWPWLENGARCYQLGFYCGFMRLLREAEDEGYFLMEQTDSYALLASTREEK